MAAQKTKSKKAFRSLSSMAGRSAIVGIVVVAISVPFFAVTTVAASASIREFDSLPDFLEIGTQPQQNRIIAYSGDREIQIATVYSQNRQEIAWDDVSDNLKNAVLAAEDRRFYEHGGIDVQGIIRAVVADITTGSTQGASTLTQQTVKNVCIADAFKEYPTSATDPEVFKEYKKAYTACNEGTLDRKIREMKYAIGLEKEYSKDEILLAYLNIANYGGAVYGIQSAAERYYNVDAKDLTLVQAASLVAIVQEPEARRLDNPDNYAANTIRRDRIIKNMATYGFISDADRDAALAVVEGSKTDSLDITNPENGCYAANSFAKQFCDYVVKNIKNLTPLGATEQERLNNWRIGGYTLYTTLDIRLQKVAQKAVQQYAPKDETLLKLGASAVTVETGTGRILTMAQNKTFDDTGNGNKKTTTAVNFNTDKDLGGSSGFQVGSTYKTFTLINWLEHNHGIEEKVNGAPRTYQQSEFSDSCNGPYGGTYPLRNDSGRAYPLPVREAFAYSVNGAFVNMALSLDLCDTRKIAQALGMHTASGKKDGSDLDTQPSSVLGTASVAPLSVAAAYAAIANDGMYCTPIAVDKVVDSAGTDLGSEVSTCTQGIPEDVAVGTQSAMLSAMATYQSDPRDGTEHIAKTGTTQDSTHTWVTASSTRAATSVWYGNIVGKYPIRSYGGGGTFAGNQRHLIMKAILTKLDQLYPGEEFAQPSEAMLDGVSVTVPSVVGMSADSARAKLRAAGFTVSDDASQTASDLPKGTVASTVPSGRAPEGSYITIYTSDESQAEVPNVVGSDVGSATGEVDGAGFTNIQTVCQAQGDVDPTTGLLPDGSAAQPDGTVTAQAPDSGTVKSKDGLVKIYYVQTSC